ncbi:uncharacterized protein LOC116307054 [Actinia tenebrosa]|uniref:Uncharacterized protein LOC116307054 n=1 Tax=Actinia tenebrosa TaxID=6105 RepID=A0A6P8J7C7_ACTTE|nr:uncharacterized protein LOC116307054 [Actinia tenebrosa]
MEGQDQADGEFNRDGDIIRDQTTQDFVRGLKEREEFKAQLREKDREVNTLKGQNYDLMNTIDSLKKQVAELSKDGKKARPTTARKPKRPAKRKTKMDLKAKDGGGKKTTGEQQNSHEVNDPFEDPEKLYAAIAQKFPELPLSTVLTAEKKFVEADINRDGTIDFFELEKILDSTSASTGTALFTKEQVQDIMRKIDLDNTNSIDFMECLAILDLLRQNRKTGLPTAMQQNVKSSVCTIQ